jgi:hypothetical protein
MELEPSRAGGRDALQLLERRFAVGWMHRADGEEEPVV